MRLVIDTLIALMLTATLGGVIWYHHYQSERVEAQAFVHRSLAQLHEQALFHKSLDLVTNDDAGFPGVIEAAWFEGELPRNRVASATHPWIDVAPEGDAASHPPDPVLTHPAQAGFWYNPNRGIFRARVPEQISQSATLRLYNELNGVNLESLPRLVDGSRRPIPHDPPSPSIVPARFEAPAVRSAPEGGAQSTGGTGGETETEAERPRRSLLTRPAGG